VAIGGRWIGAVMESADAPVLLVRTFLLKLGDLAEDWEPRRLR